MSINIGNKNKIKNSTIANNVINQGQAKKSKETFYNKHPIICGLIISFTAGFILLFAFWSNIISWIEGWF